MDDFVHLADMDPLAVASQTAGHVFIDLHDDHLCALHGCGQVGSVEAEVKVAVLVHGGGLDHEHPAGMGAAVPGQLGVAHGDAEAEALVHQMPVNPGHMAAVPGEMGPRIGDAENLRFPEQDAAPQVDILKLGHPPGQGPVQGHRGAGGVAELNPVPVPDAGDCLLGCGQLLPVKCLIIHGHSSCADQIWLRIVLGQ